MKRTITLITTIVCTITTMAQGTLADYQRAYGIGGRYAGKTSNTVLQSHFVINDEVGKKMWYTVSGSNGALDMQYYVVDLKTNKTTPMFDNDQVREQMSGQLGKPVQRIVDSTPSLYKNEAGHLGVKFISNAYNWTYDTQTKELTKGDSLRMDRGGERGGWGRGPGPQGGQQRHWATVDDQRGRTARFGDGKLQIFGKDNNLFLRNTETNEETALTNDGNEQFYYSSWGSFSTDGKYYATVKIKPAPKRYITYVNSSPTDQVQPKYYNIEYAKPGDSLDYRVPVVINLETREIKVADDALFHSQYELSTPRWDQDKHTLTFSYNERGHKVYRILELDAETGNVRPIIEEKEEKYIAWTRLNRRDLSDGKRIIWFSERDRYGHLYLYNRETGQVINQITKGKFYVRRIIDIDEKKGLIYFTANGEGLPKTNPNEDPYNIHYCRVQFNGKGFTDLTPDEGNHSVTFSDDKSYLIDTYSTVENPPVTVLRDGKTGKIMQTLAALDISKLKETDWKAPEVFVAKGRDGVTDIWGIIQRPSNFDPSKKYPIIEYIYSGTYWSPGPE